MTLLYVLFAKVVPIISVWELKAGPSEGTSGHAPAHVPSASKTTGPALGEMHP